MKISIEQRLREDVVWVEDICRLSDIVEDYCFSQFMYILYVQQYTVLSTVSVM